MTAKLIFTLSAKLAERLLHEFFHISGAYGPVRELPFALDRQLPRS